MKHLLAVCVLVCCSTFALHAQPVSSKIMDANISWSQSGSNYTGQLNVYLTDTVGIAGLQVGLGTAADTANLYNVQYVVSQSGSFWSSGNIDASNVLHVGIGSYAYHPDYYAKVSVQLDNGQTHEIVIHSTN